jgi:hypothetical protein
MYLTHPAEDFMRSRSAAFAPSLFLALVLSGVVHHGTSTYAAEPPAKSSRPEFTRLVAHWAEYGDPDYVPFVTDAGIEVAQVGFYGGHFWSLAHTPQYKGYPAHFPEQGLNECGEWFEDLNQQLHDRGVKVVGHFNIKFLVGDPASDQGPRGFFKFYKELWDEAELGPRPVDDPLKLLEVDGQGQPIVNNSYSIGGMKEYWGCLNNPHYKQMLKAWARRGIERGVDGYMINYFYRHNCLCEHCQSAFKSYLAERFKAEELKQQFAIDDLAGHRFAEIVAWHKPEESTPLKREMLRFSQIANKRAFDEVFVDYGRSLKPDLMVAQWNHLGNFTQISGDERSLLPTELWGKDEDYLWYSSGASAHYTDLAAGMLGEVTLQARYIRGAFDDKPFTIGKYESTRTRVAIAELASNGGAPMGFYTRFTEPLARQEMVRYYQFLKRYDALHKANRPHAEVLLLYPRSQIHQGNLGPLEAFKRLGDKLLDDHVLFDVLPNDLASGEAVARYRHVVRPVELAEENGDPLPMKIRGQLSRFDAPSTVRVAANRPAGSNDITLHLVNYNRQEPEKPKSAGSGLKDEKPIAAPAVAVELALPAGARVAAVEAMTPEQPEAANLRFEVSGDRLKFNVPEFLVYSLVHIRLAKP